MDLLVAFDGSDPAENALSYAVDVTDATDGSITVAYAVDPAVFEEGGTEPVAGFADADRRLVVESVEAAEERGVDRLEAAERAAADLGVTVETELLYGDPAAALAAYGEDFDGVVVGHRGRSDLRDIPVGSVATSLVERASVPVTVVR